MIFGVPAKDKRGAAIDAVSFVSETCIVVTFAADPFHWTLPPVKPLPFTVSVNCAPPALAEIGVRDEMCGPLNVKLLRLMSQTPRPWVAARRVREGSWRRKERAAARGRPVPTVLQVQGIAKQLPMKTPRSVAAPSRR